MGGQRKEGRFEIVASTFTNCYRAEQPNDAAASSLVHGNSYSGYIFVADTCDGRKEEKRAKRRKMERGKKDKDINNTIIYLLPITYIVVFSHIELQYPSQQQTDGKSDTQFTKKKCIV